MNIVKIIFVSLFLFINPLITFADKPNNTATIVFIHAFPTDATLWTPQQSLNKYFTVITLSLPGFASSTPSTGEAITMDQYAAAVKQVLDVNHIKKAIIAGESMGGYVALAFYKNYPDRTTGLILSDTQAIADSSSMKSKRERIASYILKNGNGKLVKDFPEQALSADALPSTREFLQKMIARQPATGLASALRGMALRPDSSEVLKNATVPVLIIVGDKDDVIDPKQSQAMHALAKNSKLVIIPDAGHLSNLEQPAAWNQAVIAMFYHK